MENLINKGIKVFLLLFNIFFLFSCTNKTTSLYIDKYEINLIKVYDNTNLEKEDISLFVDLYNSLDKKLENGYFNKHNVGGLGYQFTVETNNKVYTIYLDDAGLIYVDGKWYEVDAFHELFDVIRDWALNKYYFYYLKWANEAKDISKI